MPCPNGTVWCLGDAGPSNSPKCAACSAPPQAAPVAAAPQGAPAVVVNPVLTPDADFAGRSTIRFGVGEEITLGFTTTPLGQTAASFGGLQWVVSSGPATVVNDPGNSGTGTLTCGTSEGTVVLELVTAGVPPQTKASKRIQVLRPSDIVFVQTPGSGTWHRNGRASAGFEAETFLRPTDVSFSKLEYREGGATYEGTGAFERREATRDDVATNYEVIHPVRADWNPVDGGDSIANGSMVSGADTMKSGPVPVAGVRGRFCWKIPQIARVVGTRDDFIIKSLDHVEEVDAAGTLTISKGGVDVTHAIGDPDSDI